MRIFALCLLLPLTALPASSQELMRQEDAFPLQAQRMDEGTVVLTIDVAPGYGLYRSKLLVEGLAATVTELDAPAGHLIEDPFLGRQRLYLESTQIRVSATAWGSHEALRVTTQGCKLNVACYQPLTRTVRIGH